MPQGSHRIRDTTPQAGASMNVGDTYYRTVEMGMRPITITFIGSQWVKWTNADGTPGKDQGKFFDKLGDKLSIYDHYFPSQKRSIEHETENLRVWRKGLEEQLALLAERERRLAGLTPSP